MKFYIVNDNGEVGAYFLDNGEPVPFESEKAAQKYCDKLDAGIYSVTTEKPTPKPPGERLR